MALFKEYESIPRKIEAVQFTIESKVKIISELPGAFSATIEDGSPVLRVMTMRGEMAVVRVGDWIVKDGKPGTYYPMKDPVLAKGYAQT